MFFNRKDSFFLELDKDTNDTKPLPSKTVKPVSNVKTIVPEKPAVAIKTEVKKEVTSVITTQETQVTTAEAIAIELRESQAKLPTVVNVTFAPENLQPNGRQSRPRRQPGANLSNFKTMANEMFKT